LEWDIHHGDCLDVLSKMEPNSIDTVITDPPYGLKFMGRNWDHNVPGIPFWEAILRVAKPGSTLLAFGGTRTFHRLACAIEDSGWILRDCIMWLYGSGFPKSLDISKQIDKAAGAEREVVGEYVWPDGKGRNPEVHKTKRSGIYSDIKTDDSPNDRRITAPATPEAALWDGWGTGIKPSWEPIIVAQKPLDGTFAENALKYGVAGFWIEGGRIGTDDTRGKASPTTLGVMNDDGWEPKPVIAGSSSGRWPANLILDEEAAAALDAQSGTTTTHPGDRDLSERKGESIFFDGYHTPDTSYSDTGGPSRFFFCTKASRAEREAGLDDLPPSSREEITGRKLDSLGQDNPRAGVRAEGEIRNTHPTVKPLDLMRYLARLTRTPSGGIVLDPFMGSGSTGMGCVIEDRDFIGIEIDRSSYLIAEKRIEWTEKNKMKLKFDDKKPKKKIETGFDFFDSEK